MGFFNKLLWGSSKRFANDVNKWSKAKDQKIKNKVDTYNIVSKDFYERKNFIDDCKILMADVVNCYTEEEPDAEQEKELIKRMSDFYQSGKREIEETGIAPVPQNVLSAYSDMLKQYSECLVYIEKFIKQRQWARSYENEEYWLKIRELSNKSITGEITHEEYEQSLESLKCPPSPLDGTGEDLLTVIRMSNEYQVALTQAGENILEGLY